MFHYHIKENEEKTLYRVLSEWNSGKDKIRYTLRIRKTAKQYYLDLTIYIAMNLLFFFSLLKSLNRNDFIIVALILIFAIFFFFFIFARKYNPYFFTIDRKAKSVRYWTYGDRRYRGGLYHHYLELPAFRLPETEKDKYIKIRKELQQKISAETGWIFNEFLQ